MAIHLPVCLCVPTAAVEYLILELKREGKSPTVGDHTPMMRARWCGASRACVRGAGVCIGRRRGGTRAAPSPKRERGVLAKTPRAQGDSRRRHRGVLCERWLRALSVDGQGGVEVVEDPVKLRCRRRKLFIVAGAALGVVLVLASGGLGLKAHAAENPITNLSSSTLSKNPIIRLLCFFGVVRGIRTEREYLKRLAVTLLKKGARKIKRKRVEAICIPLVAAFVGWLTNWLAVQMIFYPIDFVGVGLKRFVTGSIYGCDVLQPHGLIGWQGIVPAKAAKMGETDRPQLLSLSLRAASTDDCPAKQGTPW